MTDAGRAGSEARWLALTRRALPAAAEVAAARGEPWPIRLDHCFMRVAWDHACGGCWVERVPAGTGPAYRRATDPQLAAAIAAAERMLEGGRPVVEAMNRQSLAWRGKLRE
jgi:hypothetical protein